MNQPKQKTEQNRLVETMQLPKDLFLGLPLLSMEGNRTLAIVNHKGIVCYSPQSIVIAASVYRICVTGRELSILRYSGDFVEITGNIGEVAFVL